MNVDYSEIRNKLLHADNRVGNVASIGFLILDTLRANLLRGTLTVDNLEQFEKMLDDWREQLRKACE